ncbi:MAG TPA: Uma2 family endonuclease [Candidatus Sericytochromatia bacterium]|jgi:Uma2 family endonuclease
MTQTTDELTEQRLTHSGMSWHQFKLLQKSFANSPGIRLFYYQGDLEILSSSPEDEIVKGNIGFLIEEFMLSSDINFVGTGSYCVEKEGLALAQPDESYCMVEKKPVPDLAVEVVITSGGVDKLKRYQALGVPEVWFWENKRFSLYCLRSDGYEQVFKSELLPDLDMELLTRCVLMNSRLEAVREFRRGISQ